LSNTKKRLKLTIVEKLFIPILLGTTRPKRRSYHAAKLVEKVGQGIEAIEVQLVDPADYNFPYDGNDPENKDPRYTELTARADAFFIVSPEYNHGYPGTLKRMLDSELKNYIHKPVAFAGVSDGIFGGARMIEALVNTVRELGLVATFSDVYFPQVQNTFDEQGNLKEEAVIRRIERAYTELIWMAKALKYGRENLGGPYHS
jgi:NAD(P)H-dependent FMN reductase